mmetsp:Transcript_8216/g.34306  ORF Transcript_8216/g.34306 Transcript_8216/m.34306 type:complete len:793 (-) Transcript_8216:211-2589(-)
MNDVGVSLALEQELERRLAEEAEALGVRERNLEVVGAVNHADLEHAILGVDEVRVHALHEAVVHAVVRHAPAEASDLGEILDGAVIQSVVLREDHLNLVTLFLRGARERRHDVAQTANLGDGRHLDGDVRDVQRRLLHGGVLHREVVVAPEVVVVRGALADPVGEDEIHHPRVFGNLHGELDERGRLRRPSHRRRRNSLRLVRPAVDPAGDVHVLRHAEVGVRGVVRDLHLVARLGVRGIARDDVLLLAARHQSRLAVRGFAALAALLGGQTRRRLRLLAHLREVHDAFLDARVPVLGRGVALATLHQQTVVVPVVVVPVLLRVVGNDHVHGVRRGGNLHRRAVPLVLGIRRRAPHRIHDELLLEPLGELVEPDVQPDRAARPADGVQRLVEHHEHLPGLHPAIRLEDDAPILLQLPLRDTLLAHASLVLLRLALRGGLREVLLVRRLVAQELLHLLLGLAVVHLLEEVVAAGVLEVAVRLKHKVEAVRQLGNLKLGVRVVVRVAADGDHRRVPLVHLPVVEAREETHVVLPAKRVRAALVHVQARGVTDDQLVRHSEEQVLAAAHHLLDVIVRVLRHLLRDGLQENLLLALRLRDRLALLADRLRLRLRLGDGGPDRGRVRGVHLLQVSADDLRRRQTRRVQRLRRRRRNRRRRLKRALRQRAPVSARRAPEGPRVRGPVARQHLGGEPHALAPHVVVHVLQMRVPDLLRPLADEHQRLIVNLLGDARGGGELGHLVRHVLGDGHEVEVRTAVLHAHLHRDEREHLPVGRALLHDLELQSLDAILAVPREI